MAGSLASELRPLIASFSGAKRQALLCTLCEMHQEIVAIMEHTPIKLIISWLWRASVAGSKTNLFISEGSAINSSDRSDT
jgi:hypothetical protein